MSCINAPGALLGPAPGAALAAAFAATDPAGAHLAPFLTRLLHNSVAAAAVAGVVLLAQAAFGRWLSPAWRYRLWGLVVLRLLLPALPPGPSAMPNVEALLPSQRLASWARPWARHFASRPAAPVSHPVPVVPVVQPPPEAVGLREGLAPAPRPAAVGGPQITVTYGALAPDAEGVANPEAAADTGSQPIESFEGLWTSAAIVWLLGAAFLLCRLLRSNALLVRRLRAAHPVADASVLALLEDCCRRTGVARRPPLLVTDAVAAPAAAGVWNPKLLLPPGLLATLSVAERRAVLLHELAHVRRRDVACNWLLAVAQVAHWFNPVLWLAFARLRADREAARDAMVLKVLTGDAEADRLSSKGAPDTARADDAARGYARTLLKLAEVVAGCAPPATPAPAAGFVGMIDTRRPCHALAPGLFDGRAGLERRLHMIARFPDTRRLRFTGPALALLLAGCALTGARTDAPAGPAAAPRADADAPRPGPPATAPAGAPSAARRADAVAARVARARRLIDEKEYAAALAEVDKVLETDPANDYAAGVRPLLQEKVAPAGQKDAGKEEKTREVLQAQLDRKLPEVKFEGVGFIDVIDFLRDVSGANIFVNWKALEAAGIKRDAPVTARLRDVKFSKALDVILASISTPKSKAGYTTDEGVVTITSGDDLNKNVLTRVYDIRDLIVNVPDFEPDEVPAQSTASTASTRPAGPAPRADTRPATTAPAPGGSDKPTRSDKHAEGHTRQELIDQVTRLITDTVAPDTWKSAGGTAGSIRELSGQLVITQTPENHEQIVGLLRQLRETRGIQITVESRYMSCDQNVVTALLEEWKGAGAPQSRPAPPAPPAPGAHLPATRPGAPVTAAFLDDAQVAQFLRAAERDEGSFVAAPRVTLFNGQRVYVEIASERSYVRDYTTTRTGAGDTRYEPVNAIAKSGILVDVQATAAADRQYVTLTLRPRVSALLGITDAPWPSRPPGSNLIVQQPLVKVSELQTTVSVPNNGTLLLGGLEDPGLALTPATRADPTTEPTTEPSTTAPSTTAPATRPAARPKGLFLLVKPTIIKQTESPAEFPLLGTKLDQ